jgi:hypothetical protein
MTTMAPQLDRVRLRRALWIFVATLLVDCYMLLVRYPLTFGLQVALLFSLLPLAFLIHLIVGSGAGAQRRLLGPLVFFALAFVVTLGPRALLLETGTPGRFFVLNPSTGRTAAVFIAPPAQRRERTFNTVRNPSVEASTRDWGTPVSNAAAGFAGTMVRAPRDGFEGHSSAEARMQTGRGASYLAVQVGFSFEAKAHVRPGHLVSGSLAVKTLEPLPRGRVELEVAYYGRKQQTIGDAVVSGPGSRPGLAHPTPGTWYQLFGTSRVPKRATFANLVFVVHGFKDHERRTFRLDAAQFIANARSRSEYFTALPRAETPAIWSDAAGRALSISIVMLLTVFLGYMLPLGARLTRRIPEFEIRGLGDRRTRRIVIALAVVGAVSYVVEMSTYGGYRAYLSTFANRPTADLGKFYVHTLATLATGAAVLLLAYRLTVRRSERWRLLEFVIIPLGLGMAVSYFLKAVIAIPLVTVLLFWYFLRRRAVVWLGVFVAGFAVLTPFVYLVRSQGHVRLGEILTSGYWSEFLSNLQSRFYHFESLMIATPFANSEHPWQPAVDFFSNIVPRVFWHAKPLAATTRFTQEYLMGGLHARSDIGVISLPGELWLVGGWVGVIVVGLLLGILVRAVHALLIRPERHAGTVLIAATVMTLLVFLNDGWGLASGLTSVLIIAVGWLIPLRLVSRARSPRRRLRAPGPQRSGERAPLAQGVTSG